MVGIKKAVKWLNKRFDKNCYPVVAVRDGYAQFVAYVFKFERENKPSVYYCVDMESQWVPKSVKRICLY